MDDFISATLLPLEEKINYLDSTDRRLLDDIANHLLMTHELLQNHRNCSREFNQATGFGPDRPDPEYLGSHH
ncbi:MAG: hypothetical protein ACOY4I_13620 [Bacillota bacterium]